MFYWSPSAETLQEWQPVSGWNSTFSEQDKIVATNLFFFFTLKKGFNDNQAEILALMAVYKRKFNHMKYSEEQEAQLQEALKTIVNA